MGCAVGVEFTMTGKYFAASCILVEGILHLKYDVVVNADTIMDCSDAKS